MPEPPTSQPFLGPLTSSAIFLVVIINPGGEDAVRGLLEDVTGLERILRANMPFGSPSRVEFGTFYIAYAATPSVTEQMLTNMFIGKPARNYDRILDFSTAVTGCLFFVPTIDFLDNLPDRPDPSPSAARAGDGSLRIGGLQRSAQQ